MTYNLDRINVVKEIVAHLSNGRKRSSMAFTRKYLKELGLSDEQVDSVLAERSRSLEDYILKADAETAKAAAVTDALSKAKPPDVNVKDHADYKALDAEFRTFKKKTEARSSDDFKSVKGKFFDTVYEKLDHTKPYADQLTALQKDYEEYFSPSSKPPATDPVKPGQTKPDTKPAAPLPQFSGGQTGAGQTPTPEQTAAAQFRSAFGLPPSAAPAK